MPRPIEKDFRRLGFGIAEANRAGQDHEPITLLLARVTGATAVAGSTTRWVYQWAEATLDNLHAVAAKTGGLTGEALSVSELGNTATSVSYGINPANLPAGFAPVRIPNDTPVIIAPQRRTDGTLMWLIINTQAVDGTC